MKNLVILFASFIPFLSIAFFADPTQGAFAKNIGSLSSTFIAGLISFVLVKKYGDKNGVAISIVWVCVLALGLWVASQFK